MRVPRAPGLVTEALKRVLCAAAAACRRTSGTWVAVSCGRWEGVQHLQGAPSAVWHGLLVMDDWLCLGLKHGPPALEYSISLPRCISHECGCRKEHAGGCATHCPSFSRSRQLLGMSPAHRNYACAAKRGM